MNSAGSGSTAIVTTALVKTFGNVRALDGLNLTVSTGEVHGFLGPNGAGKSTTLRVLLGLLRKNSGEASLLGGDPWHDAVALHKRVAYVPGDVNLWPNLSGGETIDLLAALRHSNGVSRRAELLERFNLDPIRKIRTYSKGNRQKVAIIAALASDAELYIFDEPTSGLDPLMQAEFAACVADLKRAGKTVLLSSHMLAEVEQLCDRITIIKEGKAVVSGSLGELRHLTQTSIVVETNKLIVGLDTLKGVKDVQTNGTRASFKVDSGSLDAVLRHLTQFTIKSLHSAPPTLEEIFMRHYGQAPTEASEA